MSAKLKKGMKVKYNGRMLEEDPVEVCTVEGIELKGALFNQDMITVKEIDHWIPACDVMVIQPPMTYEQHREIHVVLHQQFDKLLADFIAHTDKLPSRTTVLELMEWSHQQTIDPTETKEEVSAREKQTGESG